MIFQQMSSVGQVQSMSEKNSAGFSENCALPNSHVLTEKLISPQPKPINQENDQNSTDPNIQPMEAVSSSFINIVRSKICL